MIRMLYKDFVMISLVSRVAFSLAKEQTLPPEVAEFHPVEEVERKIVSKSIFIAPIFQKCPDGYTLDLHGQCYRMIRVDEQAHWNNLAARLNKFYEKVQRISTISVPVTLPEPMEYQIINIGDDPPNILNRQMSKAQSEPLRFQLPFPTVRMQQSNERAAKRSKISQ